MRVQFKVSEGEHSGTNSHDNRTSRDGVISDSQVDDVFDDLAELVLRMKGKVLVVPAERMPATTGAVAT